MIRPGSTRIAFPTESRPVAGVDEGAVRLHILAHCCKCGAEGVAMVPNNSGGLPPEAGRKMFMRMNWRMGAHRNKDVCPACAARGKLNSAPQAAREGMLEQMEVDMQVTAALDPRYIEQQEHEHLFREFPALALLIVSLETEYASSGRTLPPDPILRRDTLIQAALVRAQRDDLLDEAVVDAIQARVDKIHAQRAYHDELAAKVVPLFNDMNAELVQPKPQEVKTVTPQPEARPNTAMADAFLKAHTAKIKESGTKRLKAKDIGEATLEQLIADQARDDRKGVREVGAKRKAPLPRVLTEPKPAGVVKPAPKPPSAPEPARPETPSAPYAAAQEKRARTLALKAGLPYEEWCARRDERKAKADEGRALGRKRGRPPKAATGAPTPASSAAPTPAVAQTVPPTPEPETPMTKPQPAAPTEAQTTAPQGPQTAKAGTVQRIRITTALMDHYIPLDPTLNEGGYYREDFSDAKLAEMLDMPRAWITERREVLDFGPDVNEIDQQAAGAVSALRVELAELKSMVPRLFDEGAYEISEINERQSAQMEALAAETKRLMDAAAERVATEVAKVETRITDVEKRLDSVIAVKRR